jgi:hypothetical protein
MSVLVRFAPAGATSTKQYDETIRRMEGPGISRRMALSITSASSQTATCA